MRLPTLDQMKYLFRSTLTSGKPGICPYCHRSEYETVKRKYVVTRLVKCLHCELLFRLPNDPPDFNKVFYQAAYIQNDNITTQLPTDTELRTLMESDFKGTGKEIDSLLHIFRSLFPELHGVRLLDFGASWGYMSYQFQKAGMDVQGYEISKMRAQFGRTKLGVDIQHEKALLRDRNQIFFSSHVIEHVPSIQEMIDDSKRLTSETGPSYFIALSPNGSFARKEKDPDSYHAHWGLIHPNFISNRFYQHVFAAYPFFMSADPYALEAIYSWDKKDQVVNHLTGGELMIIVKLS